MFFCQREPKTWKKKAFQNKPRFFDDFAFFFFFENHLDGSLALVDFVVICTDFNQREKKIIKHFCKNKKIKSIIVLSAIFTNEIIITKILLAMSITFSCTQNENN